MPYDLQTAGSTLKMEAAHCCETSVNLTQWESHFSYNNNIDVHSHESVKRHEKAQPFLRIKPVVKPVASKFAYTTSEASYGFCLFTNRPTSYRC